MKSAEEIGRASLERLAAQAAANRAAGNLLRAEIQAIVSQHPGHKLTAKQVIKRLIRYPIPSVRRVQEILREIRVKCPDADHPSRHARARSKG